MPIPYTKPWLSVPDQIAKLTGYGLIIADVPAATTFLEHFNYYRFSGYCLAFEQSRHVLIPGTTFEQIRQAYEFDRALRDLVTESLEIIELDVRTTVAHSFSKSHGPFGHKDPALFFKTFDHKKWLSSICSETKRSSELFVKHFENNYSEYPLLPIWEATEIMSFGGLSRMYHGMKKTDQRDVSYRYHLQPATLGSWLHHLVYTRNLCAHHARLWDRVWTIKPDLPAGKLWLPPGVPSNGRLFASLLIQNALLRCCSAEQAFVSLWRGRVESLLSSQMPTVQDANRKMDLIIDWSAHPLWS
jgi:abortive infection bacteriophage resistance protein